MPKGGILRWGEGYKGLLTLRLISAGKLDRIGLLVLTIFFIQPIELPTAVISTSSFMIQRESALGA